MEGGGLNGFIVCGERKFFCVKTKNDDSVLFPFFFAFVMRRGDSMIDI